MFRAHTTLIFEPSTSRHFHRKPPAHRSDDRTRRLAKGRRGESCSQVNRRASTLLHSQATTKVVLCNVRALVPPRGNMRPADGRREDTTASRPTLREGWEGSPTCVSRRSPAGELARPCGCAPTRLRGSLSAVLRGRREHRPSVASAATGFSIQAAANPAAGLQGSTPAIPPRPLRAASPCTAHPPARVGALEHKGATTMRSAAYERR
jgi:hypothetical protein